MTPGETLFEATECTPAEEDRNYSPSEGFIENCSTMKRILRVPVVRDIFLTSQTIPIAYRTTARLLPNRGSR
jgi:hypothetical protein